jgi:DNA ligase-associated metallophosphoesterase
VSAGSLDVEIRGERLTLLPERGIWWAARRTLLVADTHFGKEDVWRRHGIAIPAGSNAADFERLARIATELGAARCIVLGDFVHGPLEPADAFWSDFVRFRARTASMKFEVVAGNHDRSAALPDAGGALTWHREALGIAPFLFTHHDEGGGDGAFMLSGHVHPVVRLDEGKRSLRVPVFWQRERSLVLPSFGELTGGFAVRPARGERLYVATAERVMALHALQRAHPS